MKRLGFYFLILIVLSFERLDAEELSNELFEELLDLFFQSNENLEKNLYYHKKVILKTKQIILQDYPTIFNPSLIKTSKGFLLSFRYLPDPLQCWISLIGLVYLDEDFEVISEMKFLNTRKKEALIPSQAEDARLFNYNGEIFVIYNDNIDKIAPSQADRRDMFIAKISCLEDEIYIDPPIMLYHREKFEKQLWQKNWVPFEWNGKLLFSYSLNPHEVIYPRLDHSGGCQVLHNTLAAIDWHWGKLRGGTPAVLVDGEYLAFFHSSLETFSTTSNGKKMWHYYMGAYTFSANPPFEIKKMTPFPISSKGFYSFSELEKRVIFPGGFVVDGSKIYLAYGKDDSEVWVATIDRFSLKEILEPVNK